MGNFISNESKEDKKANNLKKSNPNSKSEQNEVKIEGGSALSAVEAKSLKSGNQYKETRRTNNNGHTISPEDSM